MMNYTQEILKVKKEYINLLKKIFNELTGYYEKLNEADTRDFLIDNNDIHAITKQIIYILVNNYEIPINVIINDFMEEINRKKEHGIELNDIPTYQLSFALEEGSWLIFLRNYYPVSILHKFDRIHVLEEILWETGKGQIEDYSYYLLEMRQLSDTYVRTVVDYWKSEHIEGTIDVIAKRIMAAAYNVPIYQSDRLLDGAIRVLKSKLKDISRIDQIDTTATWAVESINIYNNLVENLEKDGYDDETYSFLAVLALYQREIIRRKQSDKIESTKSQEVVSQIARQLKWEELDPENMDLVNEFKEIVLTMLYDRPEEDPMIATINLLHSIFIGLSVKHQLREELEIELVNKIESRTDGIVDENKKQRTKVELIQLFLPNLLLKLRANKNAIEKIEYDQDQLIKDSYWDAFEDNLKRSKRIEEEERARNTVQRTIRDAYEYLIDKKLPYSTALEYILEKFTLRFPEKKNETELMRDDLQKMLDEHSKDDNSLSSIDELIIKVLSERIHNTLKSS